LSEEGWPDEDHESTKERNHETAGAGGQDAAPDSLRLSWTGFRVFVLSCFRDSLSSGAPPSCADRPSTELGMNRVAPPFSSHFSRPGVVRFATPALDLAYLSGGKGIECKYDAVRTRQQSVNLFLRDSPGLLLLAAGRVLRSLFLGEDRLPKGKSHAPSVRTFSRTNSSRSAVMDVFSPTPERERPLEF